ncbi:hypothetical protein D9R16_09720 [Corynebacterium diphtheriae]|nr:hypothetical protein D9R16_09720 [Corynebacterium diphtheriae]
MWVQVPSPAQQALGLYLWSGAFLYLEVLWGVTRLLELTTSKTAGCKNFPKVSFLGFRVLEIEETKLRHALRPAGC